MLTDNEISEVINALDVPGFSLKMSSRGTIHHKGFEVTKLNVMNSYRRNKDGQFTTPYSGTGTLSSHVSPPLSGWRDEAEIVETVFVFCQFLNDHELREFFFYHGERPYDPHKPQSRTSAAQDHYTVDRKATFGRPDIPLRPDGGLVKRHAGIDDLARIRELGEARLSQQRLRIKADLLLRAAQRGINIVSDVS